MEEVEHRLKLSVDLYSIKDLPRNCFVYLKYSYPLFGNKILRTHPPIQVLKNQEVRIENGFYSEEMSLTKSTLYPALSAQPLIIEVWSKDRHNEEKIGNSKIDMEDVLRTEMKRGPSSALRQLDEFIPIETDDNPPVKQGYIRIFISLEDFGPKQVVKRVPQQIDQENQNELQPKQFEPQLGQQSSEYQVAWELELWKRAEEAKFKAELKEKEQEHLSNLAEEWKKREAFREETFQNSLKDIQTLEAKLRNKAVELQRRENKISGIEEELRSKINESSKILVLKEEEIEQIKRRENETKQL